MSNAITVLLCGVGGQGTVLAADLLARAACAAGYDVKVSEIHGMSQRGGAVTTVVRFGKDPVASMVADEGSCDCVVAFEKMEALRNSRFVAEDGFLLAADETILPLPVLSGAAQMPENLDARLAAIGTKLIPAADLANEAGSLKTVNVVLLGALSPKLDIAAETWEEVIAGRVPPKTIEMNLTAFRAGARYARENA